MNNINNNQQYKMLIINDTQEIRELFKNIFQPLGYKVLEAENGDEGLNKIEHDLDVILLDIQMPKKDGFEVCRQVKNDPKYKDIPILFTTAFLKDPKTLNKALEMGAEDFIGIPANYFEITARVKVLTRLKRNIDEIYAKNKLLTQMNERLQEQSITDSLTEVNNRRYFDEKIKEIYQNCISDGEEMGILMFDLDHFKRINDTYGHQYGDFILKEIANLISLRIKRSDVFSRYGGEEFIAALIDCNMENSKKIAESIRKQIESYPFMNNDEQIKITISIGVSHFNSQDYNELHTYPPIETLIQNADKALYKAKKSGRNRVCI